MIDNEALQELRKLTKRDGLDSTDEELLDMGTSLLGLVEAVYRPIKKKWVEELERKDEG